MRNDIEMKNTHMPLVEYLAQRVVTFAMIDEAHRRPRDTAKKAFQRNRARFVDGDDFFIVGASEVEWDVTDHLARDIKRPGKKNEQPDAWPRNADYRIRLSAADKAV